MKLTNGGEKHLSTKWRDSPMVSLTAMFLKGLSTDFAQSNRGQIDGRQAARTVVGLIVGVLVAAIMIGALLPVAIDFVLDANTTGWGGPETTLFLLFPLLFVLVPFIAIAMWVVKAT